MTDNRQRALHLIMMIQRGPHQGIVREVVAALDAAEARGRAEVGMGPRGSRRPRVGAYHARLCVAFPVLFVGFWLEAVGEWLDSFGERLQRLATRIEGDAP